MLKWFGFLLLLGSMPCGMFGQTIRILDASREPLPGAEAYNTRTQQGFRANAAGRIELEAYRSTDTLLLSHIGFHARLWTTPIVSTIEIVLYPSVISMEPSEVVAYFGREKSLDELPQRASVIPASDIRFRNPQTAADVLSSGGQVYVQKSQMGGGSPVLRGFEANKVLLVVDGVRMNNAIYRGGHLQNAITIDPQVLQRVEVLFGPGAVMYGSDALGGVVHYRTRNPVLGEEQGSEQAEGRLSARISSANQEQTFHADVAVGYANVGFLTSVTRSSFGDLRMGSNRMHGDETWGLYPWHVIREEGEDRSVENEDPDIQLGTAYDQLDFLQKIRLRASETVTWTANFQYSTSSDIPRFDQLSEVRNGELRWAEWYYGPQQRLFSSLQCDITEDNRLYDEALLTAAFQRIDESRIARRFQRDGRRTLDEDVWVYSFNADLKKQLTERSALNYGFEAIHNTVESNAWEETIGKRGKEPYPTRYPNGGSQQTLLAAYLGWDLQATERADFKAGVRFTNGRLSARFTDNAFYNLPFDEIAYNRTAVTGSLGWVWRPELWKISVVASSGFRLPNVDDVGKVRENDGFVLTPSADVRPEYAYNAEATFERRLLHERMVVHATGFLTLLQDAIVTRDASLNGLDSLEIEGVVARIQTNQNAAEAIVYGGHAGVRGEISSLWSIVGRATYTYGQDLTSDLPLAHIPPLYGSLSLQFQSESFQAAITGLAHAHKPISRYAPGSTDNADQALANGTPAWWILNLNTSWFISRTLEAQVGLENILDVHYRTFASGISAPGRNLILGLRAAF